MAIMKTPHHVIRLLFVLSCNAAGGLAALSSQQHGRGGEGRGLQFVCDIPTSGCTNGMFNQAKCACECISPFCHDINGDCTNPSNNCGGNPWTECVRGEDCPWWVNPLKAESCTTGPMVPLGHWDIYNDKTACCNTNFAYSTTCDVQPASTQPTKHPTIAAPEDDDYEVVPIKFDVKGLPDDIKMRDLRDEMLTVLKRILLRLADRISGLKISDIEERVVLESRNLRENALENDRNLRQRRGLKQDVSLYFNVYAIRDEDRRFGPLIIHEIRDAYDEVLGQIQTFSDTKYFGGDLDLNWCTSENGKFTLCTTEIEIFEEPPLAKAPAPMYAQPDSESEGGGLAGWAVALIVISVLIPLGCIGYLVFIFFSGDGGGYDDETKKIENNVYTDDKSRGSGSNQSKVHNHAYLLEEEKSRAGSACTLDSRAARSQATNKSRASRSVATKKSRQLVLAEPQNQLTKFDDDSFTINTRGTRKKVSRDPTMYIPGQEDRLDPGSSSVAGSRQSLKSGRSRQYTNDPPLRPKREPTMYVGGNAVYETDGSVDSPLKPKRDPTMYVDGNASYNATEEEDPPLKPMRDMTVFVDGQRDTAMYDDGPTGAFVEESYSVRSNRSRVSRGPSERVASTYTEGTSVEEVWNDDGDLHPNDSRDQYEMEGIDEGEEYDRFDNDVSSRTGGSKSDAAVEVPRMSRDPTFYATGDTSSQDLSFNTEDPQSVSKESVKSKKSKGDRKLLSSRGTMTGDLQKSLQSNWEGSSMPDMGPDVTNYRKKRNNSFYK